MTTLEEDLAELSDVLPRVPDELTGLGQSARDLAGAASAMLAEVAAAHQEISGLLTHVRNMLPGLTVLVEAHDKRLEFSLTGAEKAWADGHGQLVDGEHALETAGQQVDAARTDLIRALFEAATEVDQASADGEAAIDRIESTARAGHDRIQAAAGAVTDQVGVLRALLERTKESLHEASQDLMDDVKVFCENADQESRNVLNHLMDRQEQYSGHLEDVGKEVASGTEGHRLVLARRLDAVSALVGLSGAKLRLELDALAAGARSQQDAVAKARGGLNETVGGLREAAAPLPGAIQEIHEAVLRMRQQ